MGATAATAEGLFGFGPKGNNARRKKLEDSALQNAAEAKDVLTPPPIPAPPSELDANIKSGKAMSDAVRRYRRQSGGGQSSTIKTGGAGDPSQAPTIKKTLLGV